MGTAAGPQDVLDVARGAQQRLAPALSPSGVRGSRAEWAAAVGELQRVIDMASAAQDAAVVRLAAIEGEWAEDGTVVEVHKALGHVALDAPAILSGVLNVAAVHAQRRVRQAVRVAADGPEGTAERYRAGRAAHRDGRGPARRVPGAGGGRGAPGVPGRGRRHRRGLPRELVRGRGRAPAAAPDPAAARAGLPRPAAAAGGAGPLRVGAAALGRRARRRHLARHVPLRGGLPGLGRRRRPRPAVPHRRGLCPDRPRPRQGPHRPRHRPGHHRGPGRPHHPRHRHRRHRHRCHPIHRGRLRRHQPPPPRTPLPRRARSRRRSPPRSASVLATSSR